ncbi:hypothetical protein GCM10018793_00800 [Streptomyces sulfonofaciens]|uniref:Uncharacterized protein n=1 Tax=Streptomyces sulfonofaciens TaxID=68272 RepID=A0A919FMQ8_9ACTN|nr:hypothetical protein [Streptomyces sulfonofaciens]GHH69020.1 hypothetical protein GCM10018793_00800 [Streptomyces sulfonofaciens]
MRDGRVPGPVPGFAGARVEQRLRAAFEARAGAVGHADLRRPVPPSTAPRGRLRWTGVPAGGTLAVLALAAAVACVVLVAGVLARDGAQRREPVRPAHPSYSRTPAPHPRPPTRPSPARTGPRPSHALPGTGPGAVPDPVSRPGTLPHPGAPSGPAAVAGTGAP